MALKQWMYKRNSVFATWLVSYALIIAICVIVCSVAYFKSWDMMKNEMNLANSALLKNLQQSVDNRLEDIERLSMQISMNSRVQGSIHVGEMQDEMQKYTMYQMYKDFKTINATGGFINSFYVYFKNSNQVIGPDGAYSPSRLFQIYHEEDGISFDTWKSEMLKNHTRDFVVLHEQETENKTIIHAQSINNSESNQALANIVITIDRARLQKFVNNIEWVSKGQIIILDKYDNVIVSSKQDKISLDSVELVGKYGLSYKSFNGDEMAVSYIASNVAEWKYISIIPVGVFYDKVSYIKRITIAGLIVCILLSSLVAFLLTRKNYNPIKALIVTLTEKERVKAPIYYEAKGLNEYSYIQKMIRNELNEKEKIKEEMKNQNEALRTNFLVRLLKGRNMGEIPVYDALSMYNIEFDSEYFVVMLISVEDLGVYVSNGDPIKADKDSKMVKFIITNVVEELVRKNHNGNMVEVDDLLACIINLKEFHDKIYKNELLEIAEIAQSFILKNFGVSLTISISGIHSSLAGIPDAYRQALEAMEYRLIMGRGKVINYEDIEVKQGSYLYPLEVEQQLINKIKIGDFEGSKEIVEDMFHKNVHTGTLSIQMVKCLMFDMVSTIIKTLDEIKIFDEQELFNQINPVDRLLKCETAIQMEKQMINILQKVCQHISDNKKSHNVELKDNVNRFVEENYLNVDLSLSMIADHFGINAAYLSRFYKEQAGESLIDYINKVRLMNAKQLLKSNDMTMGEIASSVGYNNDIALIRAFKKYEGITPGKYREII